MKSLPKNEKGSGLTTHFKPNHKTLTRPSLAIKSFHPMAILGRETKAGSVAQRSLLEQTRRIGLHYADILWSPVMTDSKFDDDTSFPP